MATSIGPRNAKNEELLAVGGDYISEATINGVRYMLHYFLSGTKTFSAPRQMVVDCLIVGGGGGGGFGHGGGGAGGAVLYREGYTITPGDYSIVVAAASNGNSSDASNNAGNSSSAFGVTATGGGSGANEPDTDSSGRLGNGGTGANGGGGNYARTGGSGTAPTASGWTVYAGYAGGIGHTAAAANYSTGGGGGAGGVGGAGSATTAGNGGPGVLVNIDGRGLYWGGGGGGTAFSTGGVSGSGGIGGGGGGAGSDGASSGAGGGTAYTTGGSGTSNQSLTNTGVGGAGGANTGGGGGAGANESFAGGAGGSGIVIIRYRKDNQVLSLDASNIKSYDARENLVTTAGSSNYPMSGQSTVLYDSDPFNNSVQCKYDLTGINGPFANIRVNSATTAGQTYTISMWVKGSTNFSAAFAYISESGGSSHNTSINITTSWQRFSYTFTVTTGSTVGRMQLFFGTEGNDKIVSMYGAQMHRGSELLGYVATSGGNPTLRPTTITDLIASTNTLTLTNGVGYTTTAKGALIFDGVDDFVTGTRSYVDDPVGVGSGTAISYSLECWFRITSDAGLGADPFTVGAGVMGTLAVAGMGLQIFKPAGIRVNYGLRGYGNFSNLTDLSLNTWYHVVGTTDFSSSKIYINGVLDNSTTAIGVVPTTSPFQLGYARVPIYFNGQVAVANIYNDALTAEEVKTRFNALRSRFGV